MWAHVPVLVNEQRKKLSKRRDKVALEQYRDEGYLADAMVNYLMTLGWAPKGDDRDRAVDADRARRSGSRTSPTRRRSSTSRSSTAFNGEYIRMLSLDEFVAACEPFLPRRVVARRFDAACSRRSRPLVQDRVVTLADVAARWSTSCSSPTRASTRRRWQKAIANGAGARVLARRSRRYEQCPWDAAIVEGRRWRTWRASRREAGQGGSGAVRVAVTGRPSGPPLFESLEVLGPRRALRRLNAGARAR